MRHEDNLETSKLFQIVIYSRENRGRTAVFVEKNGDIDRSVENCGSPPVFPSTELPGGNSEWEPPDPFSNSEVKTLSADGSVGSPHVRVGHRQAFNPKKPFPQGSGFSIQ